MAKKGSDPRYEVVNMLLVQKRITKFQDIFKYIKPTVVAIDMRTNMAWKSLSTFIKIRLKQ
jgi:hypothetical protein